MTFIEKKLSLKKAAVLSDELKQYFKELPFSKYNIEARLNLAYKIQRGKNVLSLEQYKEYEEVIDKYYYQIISNPIIKEIAEDCNSQYFYDEEMYSLLVEIYGKDKNIAALNRIDISELVSLGDYYSIDFAVLIIKLTAYGATDELVRLVKQSILKDVTNTYTFTQDIFFFLYNQKHFISNKYRYYTEKKKLDIISKLNDNKTLEYILNCGCNIDFLNVDTGSLLNYILYSEPTDFVVENDVLFFDKSYFDDIINNWTKKCKNYESDTYQVDENSNSKKTFFFTKAVQSKYKEITRNCEDIIFNKIPSTSITFAKERQYLKVYMSTGRATKAEYHRKMDFVSEKTVEKYEYAVSSTIITFELILYKHDIYINRRGYRPLTLMDIVHMSNCDIYIKDLLIEIFEQYSKINPFIKDLLKLINTLDKFKVQDTGIIPILFKDMLVYHDWNQLFKAKYKVGKQLNYNFNKLNPLASYILIKTIPYISKNDVGLLYDYLKDDINLKNVCLEYKRYYNKTKENLLNTVLWMYYFKKCGSEFLTHGIETQTKDWIDMSIKNKKPLSLRKESYKKIIQAHNKISEELLGKEMDKYKDDKNIIKEGSKFNELRNILPGDYEWITTSKRLYYESKLQHHCVYTNYRNRIQNDQCTIYSYINPTNNERHTIEFIYDKERGYRAIQIQKKYNSGYDEEVLKNLEYLLSKKAS